MARIGVFTDPHGQENIRTIAAVLEQEGVDKVLCLGDILYHSQTALTITNVQRAMQFRGELLQDSDIRKSYLQGAYSDAQIQSLLDVHAYGKEVNDAIAHAEYMDMDAVFNKSVIALGGNWDRQNMADVFGERFLNGTVTQIAGLQTVGCSGGGLPPNMGFMDGLLADNPETEEYQHRKWKKPIMLEDKIDLLVSHVPPTDGEGIRKDNAVEYLKSFLLERTASGKSQPGVIMSGHRHGPTEVEYNEELGTFWVRPGVSGVNHNYGANGSFIIADFDDTTKQLRKVLEYRIFTSAAGLKEVELHGEHLLNHDEKKVTFTALEKTVLREYDPEKFAENVSLDKNYELQKRGVRIAYEGLSPAEKDSLLRQNLSLLSQYADETGKKVKLVVDEVRRNMTCGRRFDETLSATDLHDAITSAFDKLAEEATQQVLGISVEELLEKDETALYFTKSILLKAAFGIGFDDIQQALDVKNPKVEALPHNWGAQLQQGVQKHIGQQFQYHVLKDLTAQDFQSMAEAYMPQHFERTRDLARDEALRLWAQTYQQVLLTADDMEETGAYKQKEGVVLQPKTKKDIATLLGMEEQDLSKARQEQKLTTQQLPENILGNVKEGITQGKIPVLTDLAGDYLLGPEGRKIYLDDEFKTGLTYTPRTYEQLLGEQIRAGSLPIINKDGKEYLAADEGYELFDPAAFGLKEGDYTPMNESTFKYHQMLQAVNQREQELASLRKGLKEQERMSLPGSRPGSSLLMPSTGDVAKITGQPMLGRQDQEQLDEGYSQQRGLYVPGMERKGAKVVKA